MFTQVKVSSYSKKCKNSDIYENKHLDIIYPNFFVQNIRKFLVIFHPSLFDTFDLPSLFFKMKRISFKFTS